MIASCVLKRSSESLCLIGEDSFDCNAKEESPLEGQRKARVDLAGLDSVDRLTRDLQPLGEIGLRPVPFSTKDTKAVLHLYLQRFTAWEITIPTTNKNCPRNPEFRPGRTKAQR